MGFFFKGTRNKVHIRTENILTGLSVSPSLLLGVETVSGLDVFINSRDLSVINTGTVQPNEPIGDVTDLSSSLEVEFDEFESFGELSTDYLPIRHAFSASVTKKMRGGEYMAIRIGDQNGENAIYGIDPVNNALSCFETSVEVGSPYGYRVVINLGQFSTTEDVFLVAFNACFGSYMPNTDNVVAAHEETFEMMCNAGAIMRGTLVQCFAMNARSL